MSRFTRFETLEKVCDLVNKRMLVSDLKARNPPVTHVRLITVGNVNASPASNDGLIGVIEILEPM
jgi:hypothetical protein